GPAVFPRSSSIIGKPLIWLSTTSITASFDRYHTLWITTKIILEKIEMEITREVDRFNADYKKPGYELFSVFLSVE
ncbi:MAG: hypothetical protein LBG87_02755, partial [Spirochaetaceae bacterium]|nr:hypothetical protein [Spirochaetaceae bacterium]